MSPAFATIFKSSSQKSTPKGGVTIANMSSKTSDSPVVNGGFKGLMTVFKTFLLVGGDLV